MTVRDPFHEGERAVQERAGETHAAALNEGILGSSIAPGAIPFISKQPWVILAGADPEGRLWCSALMSEAGFMAATPDGTEVKLDLRRAPVHPSNPLLAFHSLGRPTGALFIELATRRRLRVNGCIAQATAEWLTIAVEQAFPNCPRFIKKRTVVEQKEKPQASKEATSGKILGEAERALIHAADTLFLATLHPERGVDASHRGGTSGFVEVLDGSRLRVPDYPGNGLFNSFGNLAVDARMGMLFPVFGSGGLLHLSGTARVMWDQPDPEGKTAGTCRFLEFSLERWVLTPPAAGAPGWRFVEASPSIG